MLDIDTKKRLDDLRNILVGKIPGPQSQVEQITTGLLYKFMHDMDVEAVEIGGVPSFFVGDYEKYSWERLLDNKLGGNDRVRLYSEAIENMYTNPSAPTLCREIFKNSFLPFKDPQTLNMFLKEIDQFQYTHSENLGDAFEYLLSFMGSQGDAGQFRTPRHIIDFIVEIVNPQKNETILDPACGTAGFLISSYKHILKQNNHKLTPAEHDKLRNNLVGYDISPDMRRISLMNMFLHQFVTPRIDEYDTLSSEDNWGKCYDVILANPPFFSPTGGIRPHARFGVQSNRAEVLFIDYIIEHLKPDGRAAIIVPEGIIFQTATAYKTLRKKLLKNCLLGVISLPAGVFRPYSGVKTSILILDKALNRKSDNIFFAKVENDGFSLGAQRTPIPKNDLPSVVSQYLSFMTGKSSKKETVNKKVILESSDYSLSAGKYFSHTSMPNDSSWETVELGEVADIERGGSPRPIKDFVTQNPDGINWIKIGDAREGSRYITQTKERIKPEGLKSSRYVEIGDFILSNSMSFGRPYILRINGCIHDGWLRLKYNKSKVDENYLYYILSSESVYEQFSRLATGGVVNNLNKELVSSTKIPLPPIEVQQRIVDELEGYRKIIDGCRQVVENYKPNIDIDPSWETSTVGKICDLYQPKTITQKNLVEDGEFVVFGANGIIGRYDQFNHENPEVIVTCRGNTCGTVNMSQPFSWITGNAMVCSPKETSNLSKDFLFYCLENSDLNSVITGSAQPQITRSSIEKFSIPLPPIEVQQRIVDELEEYRKIIEGNKRLIGIYMQKIQDRICKVWGE
ncbi:MAG: N-6 DNA methylase [Chlamydiota bacterium]